MLHALPVHHDAVGGTEIDDVDPNAWTCRVHPNLCVPAGYPGVVDSQVCLAPATDHQSRRLQWMPRAVDLEYEWRPVDGSLTCPAGARRDAGNRLGGHGEAAGGQVRVKLEADLDRAVENVAHFAGVITELGRQFGDAASVDALIRANRCESWPHFLKKIRAYSFTAPVIAET